MFESNSGFYVEPRIDIKEFNSWLKEQCYIYGPDKPLLEAYFHFLNEVLIHGNLGVSMRRIKKST